MKVGGNVGVNPFRAYIIADSDLGNAVQVVFDTDGIYEVNGRTEANGIVFSIDGRRMGTSDNMSTLPKGMYICNGTKFVVK